MSSRGESAHALSISVDVGEKASDLNKSEKKEVLLRCIPGIAAAKYHLATIDDVGAMAAFLASREAGHLTGGVHDIDGGFSITA